MKYGYLNRKKLSTEKKALPIAMKENLWMISPTDRRLSGKKMRIKFEFISSANKEFQGIGNLEFLNAANKGLPIEILTRQ